MVRTSSGSETTTDMRQLRISFERVSVPRLSDLLERDGVPSKIPGRVEGLAQWHGSLERDGAVRRTQTVDALPGRRATNLRAAHKWGSDSRK